MNGIETDQVQAFLAVLATGSFTAAGRQLGRDGSVISRRIAELETRLGIRLLERSTRRVSATEAGTRYRDRVREAWDIMRDAEDEARSQAATPRGLLRISLPAGFGRMWIAPRMPEFLARYPSLDVECTYTDRYVDLIEERFDVGVRIGKLEDSRLVARPLATMRRLLCASPDYLAARGRPTKPEDLMRHECIGFSRLSTHPVWHLKRDDMHRAIRINARMTTDEIDAVLHAARSGVGIMYGTDWLVCRELQSGELVQVLPGWKVDAGEQLSVVRASSKHAAAKTRAFIDWVVQSFETPPWGTTRRRRAK
ncbi:LysR family transcriptional regulator [Caballeronia sp. LP006]|uniref:LysR family transcriptional regulator n=1 Tax=unclassified Caballeronia TaxID=2646786 RepID=UPI002028F2A7|nr:MULTISPECIES: LysR family transcriptional regulator [unclassified Caballeronia]MDR5826978.1 LysR family transcriptional regulator [Caballeronia sp. LP006]